MFSLRNKICIITGGGSGLGLATVKRFIEADATVTTPLGRMCKAEEAAALYHFLASDDCQYITGEDIYIDGGLKAGPSISLIDALLAHAGGTE